MADKMQPDQFIITENLYICSYVGDCYIGSEGIKHIVKARWGNLAKLYTMDIIACN